MENNFKKLTISVGIPAYNEEENIGKLIQNIIDQNQEDFCLEKIIIASDGSTDGTVLKVREFNLSQIEILDNKERKGVAQRMNQIIKFCQSDILIILNADIVIKDNFFIKKMINPIIFDKADLVSADVSTLSPKTFIRKILQMSFEFKKNIFQNYKNGINIYTCFGVARAFSRNFYQNFSFTESVGEDAYSYLYCLQKGFKYSNTKNAEVFIQLPNNLNDHKKQSIRFIDSRSRFYKEFGIDFVKGEYYLPLFLIFKNLILYFFKNPVLMMLNICITLYMRVEAFFAKKVSNVWEISASTKNKKIINNKKESFILQLSQIVIIRRIIYKLLKFIDDVFLLKNKNIVLCYHGIDKDKNYFDVSEDNFKKQINLLLEKGYCFITGEDFYRNLKNHIKNKNKLNCLLTFDDGYKSIFKIKEFLREKNIKPIIFILSDRENVFRKDLDNSAEFLSKEEILELKKDGWEIGSHGATHRDLKNLNNTELEKEIFDSKIVLEKELEIEINSIAYPKGFYTKNIINKVQSSGYESAFSMEDGFISQKTNEFIIPRIGINSSHSVSEFLATFSPSVVFMRKMIKLILKFL